MPDAKEENLLHNSSGTQGTDGQKEKRRLKCP
jgi:hypothetical protein